MPSIISSDTSAPFARFSSRAAQILALEEHSFIGPVFFFALFTGIMLLLGHFLYHMGYRQGGESLMSKKNTGPMKLCSSNAMEQPSAIPIG